MVRADDPTIHLRRDHVAAECNIDRMSSLDPKARQLPSASHKASSLPSPSEYTIEPQRFRSTPWLGSRPPLAEKLPPCDDPSLFVFSLPLGLQVLANCNVELAPSFSGLVFQTQV